MLKREPVPGDMPFDKVINETGKIDIQCRVCGDHSRVVDKLALDLMRSTRLGRWRVRMLYPWSHYGTLRFVLRHGRCIRESLGDG